jgi:hypothetical protein
MGQSAPFHPCCHRERLAVELRAVHDVECYVGLAAGVAKQEVSSIGRLQALQRWMTPETHKRETGTIGKKAEDRPLILNRTCLGEAL